MRYEGRIVESAPIVAPRDYVSIQDYEHAIGILLRVPVESHSLTMEDWETPEQANTLGEITAVGREWREQAIRYLNQKIDAFFRDRPVIRDGKAAAAYISMFGEHLTAASEALKQAGERLLRAGDGVGARQAREAHIRVRQAAEELVGNEDGH